MSKKVFITTEDIYNSYLTYYEYKLMGCKDKYTMASSTVHSNNSNSNNNNAPNISAIAAFINTLEEKSKDTIMM